MNILQPGQALGFAEMINRAAGLSLDSNALIPQSWQARAGARSIFLSAPLADQELALRIISLPGVARSNELHEFSLKFENDPWSLIRLLAHAAELSEHLQHSWHLRLLVIPASTLRILIAKDHTLESELLRLGLIENFTNLKSALIRKQIAEVAYATARNNEARPHLNEILQIMHGQRPGFGPAQDDFLGPFSAIQKLVFSSGVMKTRTLRNRIAGIIIPKILRVNNSTPAFVYYSFRRPTSEIKIAPITRSSRATTMIANALSKFSENILGTSFTFFASEKQPNAAVPIYPVAGNDSLLMDFSEQIRYANHCSGTQNLALGDPRSGFLRHFIRISIRPERSKGDSNTVKKAARNTGINLFNHLLKNAV
jgi:hypothetical protein